VELCFPRALGGERAAELGERQAVALRKAQRLDDVTAVDHASLRVRG
jgi:hypothetical protein